MVSRSSLGKLGFQQDKSSRSSLGKLRGFQQDKSSKLGSIGFQKIPRFRASSSQFFGRLPLPMAKNPIFLRDSYLAKNPVKSDQGWCKPITTVQTTAQTKRCDQTKLPILVVIHDIHEDRLVLLNVVSEF